MTLTPNLPTFPIGHILGQATSRAWRDLTGPIGDKSGTKNVTNGPKTACFFVFLLFFLTPSGLLRQDSDRLGHGKNFF